MNSTQIINRIDRVKNLPMSLLISEDTVSS